MLTAYSKLAQKFKSMNFTRKRCEYLFRQSTIVQRDVNYIYSGLFIGLITSFELFLEEYFIGLLCGIYTTQNVHPIVIYPNKISCKNVLTGGKKYIDWLPYNTTITRAKIFFKNGKDPFSKISDHYKEILNDAYKIRNCLAHNSDHANSVFQNKVLIKHRYITKDEKKPIGFLRGNHSSSPPTTRYEFFTRSILGAGKDITT